MIYFVSILFIVAIFFYYRKTVPEIEPLKRYALIALRSIAAVIILIYLLNPVLRYLDRTLIDPGIVLLEDRSASMNQTIEGEPKSRTFDTISAEIVDEYQNAGYEIGKFSFANGLIEKNDSLTTQSTRLQPTLEALAQDQKLRNANRIILSSDGWLQDENLDFARKLGIPIDVILPDAEEKQFELEVTNIVANRNAFIDEVTPIAVEVAAREYDGEARLTLYIDQEAVVRKTISFQHQSYAETMFEQRFQREGLHLVEVAIEPLNTDLTETNTGNNRKPTGISVTSKRKQILIVTDRPGWDTRFLKDALEIDRNWDIDLLRFHKGSFYRARTRLNNRDLQVISFHLLIAINHGNLRLPQPFIDRASQAIQNGRGLWVMGYPIMEELLPARASNIRKSFEGGILFTEQANRYETFSNRDATSIPPVDYLYVTPTANAQQLASIGNEQRSPAILFHPYGQGKALYFAFLNLWKWQMWEDENPYRLFVTDIVTWLTAQAKDRFQAYAERQVVSLGETVHLQLFALDETMRHRTNLNPAIQISNAQDEVVYKDYLKAIDQGYRASFQPDEPGRYTFRITDEKTAQKTSGSFQVAPYNAEAADRGINEPLLRFLANEKGGSVITPAAAEDFQPETASTRTFETFREIALYRNYWLLALFLIGYGLELFLRKRWGLL